MLPYRWEDSFPSMRQHYQRYCKDLQGFKKNNLPR